jgi:activator of 2-hydroxyglutaryl-CoA dehydratase
MIVAGIDVGGKNVHVVIAKDGNILAKAGAPSGINKAEAAEKLYDETLKSVELKREESSSYRQFWE